MAVELRATRTWHVILGVYGRHRTSTQSPLNLHSGLSCHWSLSQENFSTQCNWETQHLRQQNAQEPSV